MWHGLIVDIPDGWALCDGTNGTPDLRNRFVLGAPDLTNPGFIGGSTSHRHAVVGWTAFGDAEHAHNFSEDQSEAIADDGDYNYEPIGGDYPLYEEHFHVHGEGTASADASHKHSFNVKTQFTSLKPPHYEILFIMKT